MEFRQECQELFDRYVSCYRAGDATGCAAVFTPDAAMFSPFGPPSLGRAAIRETHLEWVAEGPANKRIEVTGAGCSGDLGWCIATFSEGKTGTGISLSVLARQPAGNWLISHCSLNETE